MTGRSAAALVVAPVLGFGLLAGWMTGGPAQAAGFPGAFSTVAAADGLRQSVIVPGAPLSANVVDVGAPSVQAAVDSLGNSRAFASLPYPGDTAATGSGLVRTLSGAPVPDYPLYVHSSDPIVPKQEVVAGPYAISAESSAAASKATATGGLAAPGPAAVGLVRSDASADAGTDSVVASAQSDVESFTVGPVRVGQVLSKASVALDAAGKPSRAADTRVVAAMVGDAAVAFTGAGLSLAGSNQPLPPLDPVRTALAGAGITVELMPGGEQPTGVVAPTVRITQRQASGAQVIYLLGGASAFVDGGAAPVAAPVGEVPPGSFTPGASPPGLAGSVAAESPAPVETSAAAGADAGGGLHVPASTPGRDASSAALPAAPPDVVPPQGDGRLSGAAITPAASSRAAEQLASELLGLRADAGPLYASLAVGGLLAVLVAGAARLWWKAR